MSHLIKVNIFGQDLTLKSEAQEEYAHKLASYVDGQMRRVSSQSTDPLKVAILAAMNIANDLFQREREEAEREQQARRKAEDLIQMLEGEI
ncbi:MAG: cell division protein ZapA [Nitrospinota bacterium]